MKTYFFIIVVREKVKFKNENFGGNIKMTRGELKMLVLGCGGGCGVINSSSLRQITYWVCQENKPRK